MSGNQLPKMTGMFLAGLGAGAVLALLLAPKTGEDAREYVSKTVRKGIDGAKEHGSKWAQRAQEAAGRARSKANEVVEQAGEIRDEAYRQAKNAAS